MSGDVSIDSPDVTEAPVPASRPRRKILIMALPVVLAAVGGGWFLLGGSHRHRAAPTSASQHAEAAVPTYVETPEMIVNLDAGPHRVSFAKVQCKIEMPSSHDATSVTANMPRVLDMLQTYLRATRPEELRSETGTYRLREAFLARASIAVPDARIDDVLFEELIVQ